MFLYLGLASGLIFFSITFLLQILKDFLLKPKQKKNKNNINLQEDGSEIISKDENKINVSIETEKENYSSCENNDNSNLTQTKNSNLINKKQETIILNNGFENSKNKKRMFKNKGVFYNTIFKRKNVSENKNNNNTKKFCFFKKIINKKQKNKNNNKQNNTNKKQVFMKIKKACFQVFKPFLNFFAKTKKIIINVSFIVFKVLIFLLVIVLSYLINLHLNFGFLRVGFIIIFCLAFFASKSLIKLLAIYFINFYNYFIRIFYKKSKIKKSEKSE